MDLEGHIPSSGAAVDPKGGLAFAQVIGDGEHFEAARSQLQHHQVAELDHFLGFGRPACDRAGIGHTVFKATMAC